MDWAFDEANFEFVKTGMKAKKTLADFTVETFVAEKF